MNVLQVAIGPYPEIRGGVDAMVRDLIAALESRAEVGVFVPGDWTQRRLSSTRHGAIFCHAMRLRMPFDRHRPLAGFLGWLVEFPRALRALVRLLRDGRFDLIHLHTVTSYAAYFRIAGRLAGVPYVVTLHGSDVTGFELRRKHERWMIRWGLAGATHIAAVSAALAEQAQAQFGLPTAPVVILNGIDLAAGTGEGPTPQDTHAAAPNRSFVLSVGALDRVKGHDVLIRAWALLAGEFPHTRLVIVGTGDEGDALRRLAGDLGCAESIEFTGALSRSAVLQLMWQAVVFVLPSRAEGLGLVLLEAGLAECAVVASAVGGVKEIVTSGETGALVPPEDPAALAAAIRTLLGDGEQRARLAGALSARVRRDFSSAEMALRYMELYSGVAANSGSTMVRT